MKIDENKREEKRPECLPKSLKSSAAITVTGALRRYLAETIPDAYADRMQMPRGLTYAEAVALTVLHMAVQGNLPAARFILEVTEGESPATANEGSRHYTDDDSRLFLRRTA
jgi:hypothetical protein